MKSRCGNGCVAVQAGGVLVSAILATGAWAQAPVEQGVEKLWYVSPNVGQLNFEGDEEVKDGLLFGVRLGYDYTEMWSFEGGLQYAPTLDENFRYADGVRISRLSEIAGDDVHDTSALVTSLDALFHFTRWERLDPYLSAGVGLTSYADDLGDGRNDLSVRAGGGVMWHFNDEWAIRADARTFVAGADTEANMTLDAGVVWTWGARVPRNFVAVGGPLDSDGDGLADVDEPRYGTDIHNPDTDGDGLSDGEEVLTWKTNPLNPDTDFDSLTDGYDEVKKYGTNPLKRDTDDGGVADGHEVKEDGTNPLDGSDDLILFELYINFDYDKAIIKPEYFPQIDVIAEKMLKRYPKSTARIEGHADRAKLSKAEYNQKLSERRAQAVLDYLAQASGIERKRMEAHGYGFTRPKAPNDAVKGNPLNRRVEVYIRKNEPPAPMDPVQPPVAPPPAEAAVPPPPAPAN